MFAPCIKKYAHIARIRLSGRLLETADVVFPLHEYSLTRNFSL
jgi:hypothetical protein